MADEDPFAVLGLTPDADEAAVRAARRRLAQTLHPDREGGTTDAMRRVNAAFDAALARIASRGSAHPSPGGTSAAQASARSPAAATPPPPPRWRGRVEHDVASFTIEALPVEAFEALLVVSTWLGEVVDDEPPYQLDVVLADPYDCWCRLDLVPDAGASTVALTLASIDGRPVTDLDLVRDAWVAALNTLGGPLE